MPTVLDPARAAAVREPGLSYRLPPGRDTKVRERMLARLAEMTGRSDKLTAAKRAELRRIISARPGQLPPTVRHSR